MVGIDNKKIDKLFKNSMQQKLNAMHTTLDTLLFG